MGAVMASAAAGTLDIALPRTARAQGSRTIPSSRIDAALNAAVARYRSLNEGKNADYIPALAQVPSRFFGMALVGADGKIHEAGESTELFSIQSISKVFTAALVMQESGTDKIENTVGVDSTGQVFNSINA